MAGRWLSLILDAHCTKTLDFTLDCTTPEYMFKEKVVLDYLLDKRNMKYIETETLLNILKKSCDALEDMTIRDRCAEYRKTIFPWEPPPPGTFTADNFEFMMDALKNG